MIRFLSSLAFVVVVTLFSFGCTALPQGTNGQQPLQSEAALQEAMLEHINQHIRRTRTPPVVLNAKDVKFYKSAWKERPELTTYLAEISNHWHYSFIVRDGHLYSAIIDGSFEQFLREERFFEKGRTNATEFVRLLRALKYPLSDDTMVLETKEPERWEKRVGREHAAQIQPPRWSGDSGPDATIIYWTWNLSSQSLDKWTVNISADYKVEHRRETIAARP